MAAVYAHSTDAQAVPPELRPGTKPHHFEFGPTFGWGFFGPGDAYPLASAWIDYRYHFFGNAEGPSLGVASLIGGWRNRFSFTVGPMFEWDFRLVKDKPLGLYLGPHIVSGWRVETFRDNPTYHYFFAMVGPTLKLIVNDFWVFWVRPANIDFRFGHAIYGNWGGALGAGITF
ncbi:MAG: hypothetical protein KC468_12225 [Myxococcales bacterium]|nr:hypothetical protein [Myxococcales bacterium]